MLWLNRSGTEAGVQDLIVFQTVGFEALTASG